MVHDLGWCAGDRDYRGLRAVITRKNFACTHASRGYVSFVGTQVLVDRKPSVLVCEQKCDARYISFRVFDVGNRCLHVPSKLWLRLWYNKKWIKYGLLSVVYLSKWSEHAQMVVLNVWATFIHTYTTAVPGGALAACLSGRVNINRATRSCAQRLLASAACSR